MFLIAAFDSHQTAREIGASHRCRAHPELLPTFAIRVSESWERSDSLKIEVEVERRLATSSQSDLV